VAAVAALLVAAPVGAQERDWTEVRASRQTDGVQSVEVELEYIAGELHVTPADGGLLYDTHLRYDATQMRPRREWSVDDGVGRLEMSFDGLGDDGDLDLDMDEGEHGFLNFGLSRDVPTDLHMTVGAAMSRMELGGVPLTGFVYNTGASDTEIAFDSANPSRMERLELGVGAAAFEAVGLGNARFDELGFQGGVGDVTLDFTGDWAGDATAKLKMGLGSLTLVVPPELGVRIRKSGFLAGLDAPGFEKVEGAWQTPNWSSSSNHLEIHLTAVLGSIEVRQAR
jgi:hypothetical protein